MPHITQWNVQYEPPCTWTRELEFCISPHDEPEDSPDGFKALLKVGLTQDLLLQGKMLVSCLMNSFTVHFCRFKSILNISYENYITLFGNDI